MKPPPREERSHDRTRQARAPQTFAALTAALAQIAALQLENLTIGDLDRERKTMTRLWAKREAQIQGVLEATVGMYGDLQGIAGKALPEIAALELPLLDSCEMPHREQESPEDQSNDRPVRYM